MVNNTILLANKMSIKKNNQHLISKKSVLILLLSLLAISSIFSMGKKETVKLSYDNQEVFKKMTLSIVHDGDETVQMTWHSQYDYFVIKKGSKYFNSIDEEITDQSLIDSLWSYKSYPGKSFTVQKDYGSYFLPGQSHQSEYAVNPSHLDKLSKMTGRTCSFKPEASLNQTKYEILLIDDQGLAHFLNFNYKTEFFPGEEKLLSQLPENLNYREKALTFFSTILNDSEFDGICSDQFNFTLPPRSSFPTSIELTKEDIPVDKYGINIEGQNPLSFLQDGLKKAINVNLSSMNYKKDIYSLPLLDLSPNIFEKLYGENPNIYLKAYFAYLFKKGKPVFSDIYRSQLKNSHPYDYKQYTPVSSTVGDKIAEEALKYYSGAVEYTAYNNGSTFKGANTTNPVYKNNLDHGHFQDWMNRPNSHNWLKMELIPSTTVEKPKEVQIISTNIGSDSISLVAPNQTPEKFKLSRIDLWTSKNLAWNDAIIESIEVSNGESSNFPNKDVIRNKQMILGSSNNLNIPRPSSTTGNFKIKVAYTFKTPQEIGAIAIVRGQSDRGAQVNKTKFDNEIYLKITKFNGSSAKVTSDKFTEYVYSKADLDRGLFVYNSLDLSESGDERQRKAGYGIYHHWPTEKNTQLAYSYLIFNDSKIYKDVEKIELIDESNTSFLNISEFMVFPRNPIDYNIDEVERVIKIVDESFYNNSPDYTGLNIAQLFFNTNLNLETQLNRTNTMFDILLNNGAKTTNKIETIVLWEKDGNPLSFSKLYTSPIVALNGSLKGAGQVVKFKTIDLTDHLKGLEFRTPFLDEGLSATMGNPVAYSEKGIDSPLTFNYKLHEQRRAIDWYIEKMKSSRISDNFSKMPTTRAMGNEETRIEDYEQSYVNEMDILNSVGNNLTIDNRGLYYKGSYPTLKPKDSSGNLIKPFLPAYSSDGSYSLVSTRESPYDPDKIAGVDAMGFLSGLLESSGLDKTFISFDNKTPLEQLSPYYDLTQKPNFYDSPAEKALRSNIVTNGDLERSTILINQIKDLRPGDLLINFDVLDEPQVGIVVKVPWWKNNQYVPSGVLRDGLVRENWNNVLVLTMRKGFTAASLGTWGNPTLGNNFGGFSLEPEKFQMRRLLQLTGAIETEGKQESWEVVRQYVSSMTCNVIFTGVNKERWIANIENDINPINFEVKLEAKATSDDKNEVDYIFENSDNVKILPPLDPNFDKLALGSNNIRTNKGSGLVFYAYSSISEKKFELARMTRRTDDPQYLNTNGRNHYKISYNSEYFDSNGVGIGDYKLHVIGKILTFSGIEAKPLQTFLVETFGTARPGDDFQLRFALNNNSAAIAEATEGDFMAVYDKKMLWRANLYIDEGDGDWNDSHPWIVGNDWNKTYTFQASGFNMTNLSIPTIDSGKQNITPFSFTWKHMNNTDVNINEQRVSYDFNGQDSPFEYNYKMDNQKKLNTANSYMAPSGDHSNYKHGSSYPHSGPGNDPDAQKMNSEPQNGYYPYVPGLSNSLGTADKGLPDEESYAGLAAGTDCVGFVQKSASYTGSPYEWVKKPSRFLGSVFWGENRGITNYPTSKSKYGQEITNSESIVNGVIGGLDKIIPGDMVYYQRKDADGKWYNAHVMMVYSIKYIGESNIPTLNNIFLIESISKQAWGKVNNTKKLEELNGIVNLRWYIIRLVIK